MFKQNGIVNYENECNQAKTKGEESDEAEGS